MKKILTIIFALIIFFVPAKNCAAADIWVDYWRDSRIDVFVIEESLKDVSAPENLAFKVSTKEVRNGQLLQIVQWHFTKLGDDFWRFETSEMDGEHLTVVIPRHAIFEFCMNRLGWNFSAVDSWYY